jgi:HAD superfamily hydrolase (TIGR01509 family)
MPAILFGSISTLADTSELQREAFNAAFRAHGLAWRWDRDDYRATLDTSGGRSRIAAYAAARGETVDATAVHETKSKIFQESLATADLLPRPGVVETVRGAEAAGLKVGLVTTTSRENVAALLEALAPDLHDADFAVVVDATSVDEPKPDPAAYVYALDRLDERPDDCVAIEDNVDGVRAATAAGVTCVAFPNVNTAGHEFPTPHRVDRLDPEDLMRLIPGEDA